ncbi:MAG: hypothetical protein PHY92_00400 [Alphaproteobacteria bacterium]|nr:hypothetical protein [Alphaproteobacteria bacterium]
MTDIDPALQQSFDVGFNDPVAVNPVILKEWIRPLYELAKQEFNTPEFTVCQLKITAARHFESSKINEKETPCFETRAEFTVNRLDVNKKTSSNDADILSFMKVSCSVCSRDLASRRDRHNRYSVSWKINGAINGLHGYVEGGGAGKKLLK